MADEPKIGSGTYLSKQGMEDEEMGVLYSLSYPINCVKEFNAVQLAYAIASGNVNVNFQDEHGMTALHYAASRGARPCLRVLVNSGKCDYLLRDNKGRYASDLAIQWARDYAVGRLLTKHQLKQAHERGVPAWVPSGPV